MKVVAAVDLDELDPRAELAEIDGGDHFDVIDPGHPAWRDTVAWLSRRLAASS